MTRRTALSALVAGGAVAVLLTVPAPAYAAPVAVDDRVPAYAGGTYVLDPLANDDTTLLSSGALSLCGVRGVDEQRVFVEQAGDRLVVEVRDGVGGPTRLTYDACQGDRRDSAVVTLDVAVLTDLRAVRGRRGRTATEVTFTNRNPVPVVVSWGSVSSGHADGARLVAARGTTTVATRRKALYWAGTHSDAGVLVGAGDGVLTRLRARRA